MIGLGSCWRGIAAFSSLIRRHWEGEMQRYIHLSLVINEGPNVCRHPCHCPAEHSPDGVMDACVASVQRTS